MIKSGEDAQQDIAIYETEEGSLIVDVRVAQETLWLSLNQMESCLGAISLLFQGI